jgi:hypothetical protein
VRPAALLYAGSRQPVTDKTTRTVESVLKRHKNSLKLEKMVLRGWPLLHAVIRHRCSPGVLMQLVTVSASERVCGTCQMVMRGVGQLGKVSPSTADETGATPLHVALDAGAAELAAVLVHVRTICDDDNDDEDDNGDSDNDDDDEYDLMVMNGT